MEDNMELKEAKQILNKNGYYLLEEYTEQDIKDFIYEIADEIERYLKKCKYLKGEIWEFEFDYIDEGEGSIMVKFNKIRPDTKLFTYRYDSTTRDWEFRDHDSSKRIIKKTGDRLNMINYTIEVLEDMDNELGYELQQRSIEKNGI
jgi:3-dehydroquinate dehydratase